MILRIRYFTELDADRSGELSREEVRAAIRKQSGGVDDGYVDQLIEVFDQDGNGTLNQQEFEAAQVCEIFTSCSHHRAMAD
eukprot:COSAG01_NODE_43272_length_431_cov_1.246988_1_plen_81_part_00